jgi:Uma2 family endonuclease
MPATPAEAADSRTGDEAMSVQVVKRSFTVAEYRRMVEAGILSESDRVELIDGEVFEMSPIGKRHAACVGLLTRLLTLLLQHSALVWVQNPIRLDNYSEPQPDLVVLKFRPDFYRNSLPTPEDLLLVIEVADTTLEYDRQVKIPLYARAGVHETWVVNLLEDRIETDADPADGVYRTVTSYGRGEKVHSRSLDDLSLSVAEVIG